MCVVFVCIIGSSSSVFLYGMRHARETVVRSSRLLVWLALALAPWRGGAVGSSPYDNGVAPTPRNQIDQFVFARLHRLNIRPASECSDAVFVRRAYLDVIGTLPTPAEAEQYILDHNPKKRGLLVSRLLERPEFADYWAMKWGDLLRIKAEFPVNLWPNAAQAYHRWVWTSLRENRRYDQFARDLLTASGSNYEVPAVNFYRALQNKDPQTIARTVALTFMGARAEKWPPAQWTNLAVFFANVGYKGTSEWKEEIVFFDRASTNAEALHGQARKATLPDGTQVMLAPDSDPRAAFAAWLTKPKNSWFARAMVNRVWSWLLGRGIIQEPDDLRPDNPPSDPALLAWLERELVSSGYDLKHIYRTILDSETYALSAVTPADNDGAVANFACYPLRRLDAEVLIDALNQIAGSTESYSSQIPEPFTVIPAGRRSISLPDGSISSAFLEQFGRPPRDTGLESERNNRITAAQRLSLLNASHVQRKIEQSRLIEELATKPKDQIVSGMYLQILSRFPTTSEAKAATDYLASSKSRARDAAVDLAWALLNSAEFAYRH